MLIGDFDFPDGLKYAEGHVWVKAGKKAGEATIGITSLGASLAKEIVHIDLPDDEEKIEAGKPLATYETIKSVSEVTLPFACTIESVNEKLLDMPSLINTECYGDGWIAKIKMEGDPPKGSFMGVKDAVKIYKKILGKEKERYAGIYD